MVVRSDPKARVHRHRRILGRERRVVLALALVTSALAAASASAYDPDASVHGNYRGQCRRLTKQIAYYEKQILPLSIQRGDLYWRDATREQIQRLWNKRADLCPKYGRERTRLRRALAKIREFNETLAKAGRAAAKYFTGGAVP